MSWEMKALENSRRLLLLLCQKDLSETETHFRALQDIPSICGCTFFPRLTGGGRVSDTLHSDSEEEKEREILSEIPIQLDFCSRGLVRAERGSCR